MTITLKGEEIIKESRCILREAKDNNRLILFIGSGVSLDSGMPSWKDAVLEISSKLPFLNDNENDYLKIPQYYFNEYGKKEYTQLIRKIFKYGNTLKTTELHKKIINLHAQTIITTNYDHLIEQACEENGEIRYVISKDTDLPYKNSPYELIKMHGDFENDNFVLKEDDYLRYSSNFNMIESYIKSLFGTKVVMFIGYSLNDPDVKQILTWTKDILKDDFQRAYLVLPMEEPNELKKNYFKNLGVNIIYISEIFEKRENDTHTQQLIDFFNYVFEDKGSKTKDLDFLYNELKPFQHYNYVYKKYVLSILNKVGINCNHNGIYFSDNDNNKNENLEDILKYHINDGNGFELYCSDFFSLPKMNIIKKVLVKSDLIDVKSKEKNEYYNCNYIVDLIKKFDYKALYEIKEDNSRLLNDNMPELYMQTAYISSVLNDMYFAYNCYKNASRIYCRDNNFTWYFLAQLNRKVVANVLLKSYKHELSKRDFDSLMQEYKELNIEQILETIPDLDNYHNKYLRELVDRKIVYDLVFDIIDDGVKAEFEANSRFAIYFSFPSYIKISNKVRDYFDYENNNYFIFNKSTKDKTMYFLYINNFINYIKMPDEFDNMNIAPNSLSTFEIMIILHYLNASDLNIIIKTNKNQHIPFDDEATFYLKNIADSILTAGRFVTGIETEERFWVYIQLLSFVKNEYELIEKVFNRIYQYNSFYDIIPYVDYLESYLANFYKKEYCNENNIWKLATKMLDDLFDDIIATEEAIECFVNLFKTLMCLCKTANHPYADENRIKKLINLFGAKYISIILEYIDNDVRETIIDFMS